MNFLEWLRNLWKQVTSYISSAVERLLDNLADWLFKVERRLRQPQMRKLVLIVARGFAKLFKRDAVEKIIGSVQSLGHLNSDQKLRYMYERFAAKSAEESYSMSKADSNTIADEILVGEIS